MDLTRENMAEVFKGFQAKFAEGLQRGLMLPVELQKYRIKLDELSIVIPSTTAIEIHEWLAQLPGFVEWIGERKVTQLDFDAMRVLNRKFHQTVSVKADNLEDDKVGVYGPMFNGLGAEAGPEAFWLDLAISALLDNGKWVDNLAFFHATRKYGKNTIANVSSNALSQDNLITAWSTMIGYLGPKNIALGSVPTYLLTGGDLFPAAKELCESDRIADVSNKARGLLVPRMHESIPTGRWFVLGRGKGGVSPVAVQQRKKGDMLVRKDRAEDDNIFFQGEAIYGSDARGEGFKTLPHLAYAGGVS